MSMLRTAQQSPPVSRRALKKPARCIAVRSPNATKHYQFGTKANGGFGGFALEPGADKKFTYIYWGEHMFDENMPGANENWNNPMPSGVGTPEEFGIEGKHTTQPPGAYAGVNRKWVGHKPSRVTAGYYASGMALRDSWGPDMETDKDMGQAKPEVIIDRVSVDWFLDEFSVPKNDQKTVMESCIAKHTRNYRINNPTHDNMLDRNTVLTLLDEVRFSTMSLGRRLTMLGAVQNGKTEWFCRGLPLAHYASQLRWLILPPAQPSTEVPQSDASQVDRLAEILVSKRDVPSEDLERSEIAVSGALHSNPEDDGAAVRLLGAAARQAAWLQHQDTTVPAHPLSPPDQLHSVLTDVRHAVRLLHALSLGTSPTLCFVNGKAHNIGAGLAVLSNYAALRTEAELTFHGGSTGTTPIGGLLRHFRDAVVDVKYPGLGEYIMLTGDKLCHGDARRLGWTAVHAPTDIHLNERMLHDYLNMHGQGEEGNANRILHSALFNDTDQSHETDRCSVSATKARWIRECFAGKESIPAIKEALRAVVGDAAAAEEHDAEVHVTVTETGDAAPGVAKEEQNGLTKQQWATMCLGLMEGYAPLPQALTLAMLRKARSEQLSLTDCLALEYRCFVRTLSRPDFVRAQICLGAFDGAKFPPTSADWKEDGTPHWSPASDTDVDTAEVERLLSTPLEWSRDGTTELDLTVETLDLGAVDQACHARGIEVVEGLGEREGTATPDNAHLPQGINIYRVARHPQTGAVGSHREDTAPAAQLAYKAQLLQEADERLREKRGRIYDRMSGEPMAQLEETERETVVREARHRWDMARLVGETQASPETRFMLNSGIDVGGEMLLSPEGRDRHSREYVPYKEPVYGDIPRHHANITTHYYSAASGLPPKQIRNWNNLERFIKPRLEQGKSHDEIARAVFTSDL